MCLLKINSGWPLMYYRMQAALAEMSIEDDSKDLDDDVEFSNLMGMVLSNPIYKALIWCRGGRHFRV